MIKELTVQTDHESLFAKFRKLSPKVTGGLVRMREEAYSDGKVPAKFKTLTAVAISVAIRCEPCIKAYVEQAVKRRRLGIKITWYLQSHFVWDKLW